jgi:hypothetical protein
LEEAKFGKAIEATGSAKTAGIEAERINGKILLAISAETT